jgi:HK97 family phage prohead protease
MKTRRFDKKSRIVGEFAIKAKDEQARTFSGTLSTSHIDEGGWLYRDIVWPGAFKRTLDHFRGAKDGYIPLVDSHDYSSIFNVYGHMLDGQEVLTGKTLVYEIEDGGTLVVPEMLLDTKWQVIDGTDGDRLLDRLRPGSVRKMSMGYDAQREDFVQLKGYGKVRNLRELKLGEGSLVVFPMNHNADVQTESVKSLIDALRGADLRTLSDNDRKQLRALLDAPPAPDDEVDPPADAPKGLAPDDPRRIAAEALIRDVTLQSLATR